MSDRGFESHRGHHDHERPPMIFVSCNYEAKFTKKGKPRKGFPKYQSLRFQVGDESFEVEGTDPKFDYWLGLALAAHKLGTTLPQLLDSGIPIMASSSFNHYSFDGGESFDDGEGCDEAFFKRVKAELDRITA